MLVFGSLELLRPDAPIHLLRVRVQHLCELQLNLRAVRICSQAPHCGFGDSCRNSGRENTCYYYDFILTCCEKSRRMKILSVHIKNVEIFLCTNSFHERHISKLFFATVPFFKLCMYVRKNMPTNLQRKLKFKKC
jgi:hypothetical protein